MKKHTLAYALLLAGTGLLSITGTAIVGSVNAENTAKNSSDAPTMSLATSGNLSATHDYAGKDETVYVITGAEGETKSIYLGSTLYSGEEALPYRLNISYALNGNPISAADLAGKSGHVKISYQYEPVTTYQNKYIPFVAMTSISLNSLRFNNVKLTNAKIIDEENLLILGYGIAGLNANLGTDFLPDGFTIEADVSNFALGDSYTVLTSELLANLDVSSLTTVDGLINSVNQLADGAQQLVTGSTALADGANELASGIKKLWDGEKSFQSGLHTLSSGIASASEGAKSLNDGLTKLTENSDALNMGASRIFDSILATTDKELQTSLAPILTPLGIEIPELTQEDYATALDTLIEKINNVLPSQMSAPIVETLTTTKTKLASVDSFCTNLQKYTDGVGTVSAGSAELASGLSTITSKMPELNSGAALLINGTETVYRGAVELTSGATKLKDGINTFKTEGIDRLVNFANQNLSAFTNDIRGTVSAARSYHDFGHTNAKSVKFIVKIAGI